VADDRDAVRRAAPAGGWVPLGRRRERLCVQPAEDAAWVAKYATAWERFGMTAESFAQRFNVPVRIRISAVHGL
jgi:hypothetical protein